MTIHHIHIGIDVSKRYLDIFDPRTGHARIENTPEAIAAWLDPLETATSFAVFEATGSYDAALRTGLQAAGLAFARLNPTQTRRFAQATGRLAKTDRIDAAMLADLGTRLQPGPSASGEPERERLGELGRRRDQLVDQRTAEKVRKQESGSADALVRDSLEAHIAWLDNEIARLDAAIAALIAGSEVLKNEAELLLTVPGIGKVTTTALLALMPELGHRKPGQIAALAGLAPFNADSGLLKGIRRIQGGRRRVRRALYMAAVTAARSNSRFKSIYQRLIAAGKPAKVAFIAVARKLLITLNAIVRDQKPYCP